MNEYKTKLEVATEHLNRHVAQLRSELGELEPSTVADARITLAAIEGVVEVMLDWSEDRDVEARLLR